MSNLDTRIPVEIIVREKAARAGLWLGINGRTYVLRRLGTRAAVTSSQDLYELIKWLDMHGGTE